MKPTVSYIRGLRDVLELDRDQRRDYITRQKRKEVRGYVIGSTIALGGSTLIYLCMKIGGLNVTPIQIINPINLFTPAFAGGLYIGANSIFLELEKRRIIEAGKAHRENILNNTQIPSGLEREAFD